MPSFDIRVEGFLKFLIEEIASRCRRSVSEIAKDLAWIGIEIQRGGGVEITGPLGLTRPLARLDFGGGNERLSIWLDEELVKGLKTTFGKETRGAMREAMRLGILLLRPNEARVKGPFGLERPLAVPTLHKRLGGRVREAYERLASSIRSEK